MAFKDNVGSLDRIAEALEDMTGGGALPVPTPEDSGKVLGVDNAGKWELTSGGSGGNVYMVELPVIVPPDEAHEYFETTETVAEIKSEYLAGKTVMFHFDARNSVAFAKAEQYVTVVGYSPAVPAEGYEEGFLLMGASSAYVSASAYWITDGLKAATVTEGGKLKFEYYYG